MIHGIFLSGSATKVIEGAAIQGYEALYKEERLGILLGHVSQGIAQVEQAVIYRGGERTRTAASVDPYRFEQRVNGLQYERGLRFLGTFHTHNEIAGNISSAPSHADKKPLCENPLPLIEVIVAIWFSNDRVRQSQFYFQGAADGYRYRIAAYDCPKYQCLPVFSVAAQSA